MWGQMEIEIVIERGRKKKDRERIYLVGLSPNARGSWDRVWSAVQILHIVAGDVASISQSQLSGQLVSGARPGYRT